MSDAQEFFKFKIGNTKFALNLLSVKEIIHIPEIVKLPLTTDFILGISNLRGEIIPIIDLKKCIFNDFIMVDELSRIVIVEINNIKTGILIESIYGIDNVDEDLINVASNIEGIDSKFVSSVYTLDNKELVAIINLDSLIDKQNLQDYNLERNTSLSEEDIVTEDHKQIDEYGEKILSFRIADQSFAIEIAFAREIIEMPKIEIVPSTSNDILGVFSLRDEIIPIIDIARRLSNIDAQKNEYNNDLSDYEENINKKVIIFYKDDIVIGLLVDGVKDVITPYKKDIVNPPNTLDSDSRNYIKAIYKDGKSLTFILDEDNIVGEEDIEEIVSLKKTKETKQMDTSGEVRERKLAIFNLDNEEFAIFIEDIHEINRLPEVTEVPQAADFIEGIINLRGEIIPVINLRERLGFMRKEFDEFERVIIVNIENQKTGIIVDRVKEIKSIPENLFKPVPVYIKTNIEKDFIKFIVNIESENRIITVLSIDNLFSVEEKNELSSNTVFTGALSSKKVDEKSSDIKKKANKKDVKKTKKELKKAR